MLDYNQAVTASSMLLEKAEPMLQRRWQASPSDWRIGWKLAEARRQLGKLDGALQSYIEVLNLNPSSAEAQYAVQILSGQDVAPAGSLSVSPVPFVLSGSFLSPNELATIWTCILANEEQFSQSAVEGGVDLDYRNSRVLADRHVAEIKGIVLGKVRKLLDAAWGRLGLERFAPVREELQLTSHSTGEFYNAHSDVGSSQDMDTRVITYVIYLFREPSKFQGGDLILYDWDADKEAYISKFTRIRPRNNSIVLFPSNAWHQVTPVRCDSRQFGSGRFTINGWLHRARKKRPDSTESAAACADRDRNGGEATDRGA